MADLQELLTADELADRLSIRPSTVIEWSRRGVIPRVTLSPKVLRYRFAAVVEALEKRNNGLLAGARQ